MASSRARPTPAEAAAARLIDLLRSALERPGIDSSSEPSLLGPAPARRGAGAPVIVAYSGGRDSVALLHLMTRLARQRGSRSKRVLAVHVHHGLSRQADAWAEFCATSAEQWGAEFELVRVKVRGKGQGVEAAARAVRYEALARVARAHGAGVVLAAHHLDDQLETFLIQWMRGAGPEGLAGFPAEREFAEGGVRLVRPFAGTPRAELEAYVAAEGLAYVDDDSNEDTRLLRNALRLQALPLMDAARPGFRGAAARSIELLGEAADVLRSVAAEDLAHCRGLAAAATLRVDRLLALTEARQALVLRAWLAEHGLEAPSRTRLLEALRQVRQARSDARLLVRLGKQELRRFRNHLVLRPAQRGAGDTLSLQWRGEAEIAVPSWGGALHFIPDELGFDAVWLRAMPLALRGRAGGERFKPAALRPSKTLKRLFQEAEIPEFDRTRLPLVWRGESLIYVAGLGADVRFIEREAGRIRLEWRPDRGLIGG